MLYHILPTYITTTIYIYICTYVKTLRSRQLPICFAFENLLSFFEKYLNISDTQCSIYRYIPIDKYCLICYLTLLLLPLPPLYINQAEIGVKLLCEIKANLLLNNPSSMLCLRHCIKLTYDICIKKVYIYIKYMY